MSSKSYYTSYIYPHQILPQAVLNTIPSPTQYDVRRRGNRMLNKIDRHSLFLNAGGIPSEKDQSLVEIKSTDGLPDVQQTYFQILDSVTAMERNLKQRIDDLHANGVNDYVNKQIDEAFEKKGH